MARYFTGFLVFAVLFSEFLIHPQTSPVVIWLFLILALVLGALVGYVVMCIPKLGVACVAVWLALILAVLLQNWVLHSISTPHNILAYLTTLVLVVGMIYLS